MPDLKYSICVGHHLMHYKNGWLKYMLFFCISRFFLGGDGGSIFYLFILISDFEGTFEEEKSGELLVVWKKGCFVVQRYCSPGSSCTNTHKLCKMFMLSYFFFIIIVFCFVSNFHFHALYSSFIQHNSLDQEEFSTFQPEDSHTGWQRQRCKINAQITERMDS